MLNTFKTSTHEYLRDETGNFAILGAVTSMILMLGAGIAVDHSNLTASKAKSQYTLDASVMAAARHYEVTLDKKAAKAVARKTFKENCASFGCVKGVMPKFNIKNVSAANTSFQVSGDYDGAAQALFLDKLMQSEFGYNSYSEVAINLSGGHHEVYLAMDMSASVGIAFSQAGMDLLKSLTAPYVSGMTAASDGCAFACHQNEFFIQPMLNGAPVTTYEFAKANNIRLREDDVIDAATQVVNDVFASGNPNVKVGAYAISDDVTTIKEPTNTSFSVRDSVTNMNLDYWATRYEVVMPDLTFKIGQSGSGISASEPKKSLIIVTDGLNNNYDAGILTSAFSANRCTTLKENGVQIAVLHMPYPDLSGQSWYEAFAKPHLGSIPAELQECASSSELYFSSSSGNDISDALGLLTESLIASESSELAFRK